MAHVSAFQGFVYNKEKIADFGDVCTPPYDVIPPEEQEAFYKKHPNNIIRLILNKATDADTEKDNPHTRAADFFKDWIDKKILVQDAKPAIYFTSVDFQDNDGNPFTRWGMIARVGLEPFEKGIILPHEKTFSKVKTERLNLMKQCHANFSPIFSLYSDPEKKVMNCLQENAKNRTPDMVFTDTKGMIQKMWRIVDESALETVTRVMSDKILYIADGHHRYETALNYRNWAAQNRPDFSDRDSANFVMMYLCSMDEPGLVIFPAHRLLKNLESEKLATLVQKAEKYFDVSLFPFDAAGKDQVRSAFLKNLASDLTNRAIGVYLKKSSTYAIFKARPNVMEDLFAKEMPQSLLDLDVTVLTRLLFMEILAFDQAMLDDETMIGYNSNALLALKAVDENQYDVSFILNPTRIEQVRQVAQEGLIMPRKSTYFYPKVITGQAIHKVG
jgi:uncharacterized protein (DUF1015 family)